MYSISDYAVNYFLRNASHIYACTHPNPKFMIWPKRPHLAFSVAETSVAEMSGPKRPRPKCTEKFSLIHTGENQPKNSQNQRDSQIL